LKASVSHPPDTPEEKAQGKQAMHSESSELPMFGFNEISVATSNFDRKNKLGQGGFGPVYKVTKLFSESPHLLRQSNYFQIVQNF